MTKSRKKQRVHLLVRIELLVRPKSEVPDPEKKDLLDRLRSQGYDQITGAIRAKYFQIKLSDRTLRKARADARAFGKILLANSVIENFEVTKVEPIKP